MMYYFSFYYYKSICIGYLENKLFFTNLLYAKMWPDTYVICIHCSILNVVIGLCNKARCFCCIFMESLVNCILTNKIDFWIN